MQQPPQYAPPQITLPFAGGRYTFALPLPLIAELQQRRGLTVTWPDGSSGKRPKPFGAIWRDVAAMGEYDPLDCVEIIRLGLVGGAEGERLGEAVRVTRAVADALVADHVANEERLIMPTEDIWRLAAQILMAVCQGYAPKKDDGADDPPEKPTAAGPGSSTSPQP